MGQQQLILLVLGIVIVGLAVMVGIQTFELNRRQAAADDVISTSVRIAGDGIAWSIGASALGGGGGDPENLTFTKLVYETNADDEYLSGDGIYTLAATATEFVITASDATNEAYAVTAVYGPHNDCIVTDSDTGEVPTTPEQPAACTGW